MRLIECEGTSCHWCEKPLQLRITWKKTRSGKRATRWQPGCFRPGCTYSIWEPVVKGDAMGCIADFNKDWQHPDLFPIPYGPLL